MGKEDFVIIFIMILVVGGVAGFAYSVFHGTAIDYNEECMREMAVNHCESEGMYFNKYFSGTIDSEYFVCKEDGRGEKNKRFDYSAEEMDNCMIKDANSFKDYKSKWELSDAKVFTKEVDGNE